MDSDLKDAGLTVDTLTDVKLVIEGESILNMPSIATALHCCLASYYIFNMCYPLHFSPILLFLEGYFAGGQSSGESSHSAGHV